MNPVEQREYKYGPHDGCVLTPSIYRAVIHPTTGAATGPGGVTGKR